MNPLGISSKVFGFPTLVSSFRSRAFVLDRVCLPPGDPLLVPDDSCSPGLVPDGSSGPGVVSLGSPGPLLTASASPLGSSAGCFPERFGQFCALCPFQEQALQRFKTAFILSSDPPASSSTPPLRREVKGPCCRNPSGMLDWGPARRCLSGPLRVSVVAATRAWSVLLLHDVAPARIRFWSMLDIDVTNTFSSTTVPLYKSFQRGPGVFGF
jgi:hypothetical protein